MRRVFIIVPRLGRGGVERFSMQLARGFTEIGIACDLIALLDYDSDRPSSQDEGFRTICLATRNQVGLSRFASACFALRSHLARVEDALIISSKEYANVVTAFALSVSGTRHFWVPTRHVPLLHSGAGGDIRWYTASLYKWIYRRADAVVGVSTPIADQLRTVVGARAVVTSIPNPVLDPTFFSAATEDVTDTWWPNDMLTILSVGRLTRQKGFDSLLHAFAGVRDAGINAKLIILGEGEDRADLERIVVDLGLRKVVAMPGHVDSPAKYLARCDLFVLSSRWEGMPTVLIEAVALGRSVVATDCPTGPRELLGADHPGLVSVDDPSALASAIANALLRPHNGLTDVSNYYTTTSARSYLRLASNTLRPV